MKSYFPTYIPENIGMPEKGFESLAKTFALNFKTVKIN